MSWTLYPGIKTQDSKSTAIVASIGATCTGGQQLQPATAPAKSADFSISFGLEVVVQNDSDVVLYQGPGADDSLSKQNPYGFRAIWIGWVIRLVYDYVKK